MKKLLCFCLASILLVSIGTDFSSCTNASASKRVDSKSISSVVTWHGDHIMVLDALRDIPSNEKMAYLLQHWPTVYEDLAGMAPKYYPEYFVSHHIDSIALSFGSGNITAGDKDKKAHLVSVDEELFAFFYVKGDRKSPRKFFVRCINGWIEAVDDDIKLSQLGATSGDFTINSGEGVNFYRPFRESIKILNDFGFPIFEKREGKPMKKIDTERALQLEDSVGLIRVFSPYLQPGTHFDMLNRVCTLPNGEQIVAKQN